MSGNPLKVPWSADDKDCMTDPYGRYSVLIRDREQRCIATIITGDAVTSRDRANKTAAIMAEAPRMLEALKNFMLIKVRPSETDLIAAILIAKDVIASIEESGGQS